ncbi:MAG: esterase, partial [Selenomonadaceae bacterium]|nr:esterase [Selenomonadaceae bacterium]
MMMEHGEVNWYSQRLQRTMNVRVYGSGEGVPMLVFPSQDAMCDNFENFGMIDVLAGDIESRRIQ